MTQPQGWPTPPQTYPPPPYGGYSNPTTQNPTYAPRPTTQGANPTPVLPPQKPAYVQNYQPPNQSRPPNQPRNPTVPVAQVEYEPPREDDLDDYVEGNYGELVPMYYTTAKLQFKPPGRINIKCFGCGGPHKKIDCPHRMLPGAFLPLCGDCGPGHPVAECPLRIQPRLPQVPTTPVNMIGTEALNPSYEEVTPVLAITRARAQNQVVTLDQPREPEVQSPKTTPIDYPNADLEIGRLKALQEWIDEERLKFEAKKASKDVLPLSEGGSLAEPPQSSKKEEVKETTSCS